MQNWKVLATLLALGALSAGGEEFSFPGVAELPQQEGLPDLFLMPDGSRVQTKQDWLKQRRYLKAMLAHYQYGSMPPVPRGVKLEVQSEEKIMDGAAVLVAGFIPVSRNGKSLRLRIGILRPNRPGRFPVIIKNDIFRFDEADIGDPARRESYRDSRRFHIQDFVNRATVRRGYVQVKFIRGDLAADNANSRNTGVLALYPEYDWGAIAAWAWGYSVILNALQDAGYADFDKIIATGHSRGGKTALCAGVYEERIAVTAPNSSGAGGTASWRFHDPEQRLQTIAHHVKQFRYWWTPLMYSFAGKDDRMPFDAHVPKALIAPRALVNMHARQDFWANPYGTYLTHLAAREVYKWMGLPGRCGIHWRDGGHNQQEEDWLALLDFCDRLFYGKATDRSYQDNPYPDKYTYDVPYARWPAGPFK